MIIEIQDLVKRYDSKVALNHFNLEVETGEILGLLGPNGCGKTTAINCMLSLLTYDQGDICLFGEKMTPIRYDLKQKIGVVPQEIAVFEELTVLENIDYYCGLYVKDHNTKKQYIQEAIDLVGLNEFEKFVPKKLSGGLKRRLNIACGIVHKPKLIFLDEPTVAVDPQSRNKILENIQSLNKNGSTIIYTSHYMEEVEQLCDRIVIMEEGQVLAQGSKEQLIGLIQMDEKIIVELPEITDNICEQLLNISGVQNVNFKDYQLTVEIKSGQSIFAQILKILEDHQLAIGNFHTEQPTLNDVFLEITGRELRDGK